MKTTDQKLFLEAAMNVFLRVTDYFLSEFQKNEKDFVDYIRQRISHVIGIKERDVPIGAINKK
ncbi:MAG: hypothetical protein KJ893_01875 [Candidatus Omnitrophica bacterium]|nr:hypothetical protein [Candidatus Omnitrophota bacterium]